MPASVTDLEVEFLKALGFTGSISDMEFGYYSGLSGLPVANSLTDHQRKYWETAVGFNSRSISDLEKAFYDLEGIPAGSTPDRQSLYWARNIPAAFVGGFGIQGGTVSVTMPVAGVGVPVKANDLILVFTVSKLSGTNPTPFAGSLEILSQAVGVGIDGVDTGLIKLEAFWAVATQDTPPDPVVAVAGGNVVMGNGIIFRGGPNKLWVPPVATFGNDAVHDLAFAAGGGANLNAKIRDIIAYMGCGTANTAITGNRTITVPGCTGNRVGVNSTGTNTGNHAYVWEDYFQILTGVQSGAATVNGTFAANQSGGAIMVRVR